MLIRIALRNIFRHKTRSMVTISAIAMGCTALIFTGGFFADTFWKLRENGIQANTGHIRMCKMGFSTHQVADPLGYFIDNPKTILEKLKSIVEIQRVQPEVNMGGVLSTGESSVPCWGIGLDPKTVLYEDMTPQRKSRRAGMLGSGTVIETGEPLNADDPGGILLGMGLAENIGAQQGMDLILLTRTVDGSINGRDVRVRGIYRSGVKERDEFTLQIPLKTAQELLRTSGVQYLSLFLYKTESTPMVLARLKELAQRERWPVEFQTWEELNDFYRSTKNLFDRFFLVVKIVIALIVFLSIFNTLNMAVLERTQEIGTLMALGGKRKKIVALFVWEGTLLGGIGGGAGIIVGIGVTKLFQWIGIPFPPPPAFNVPWLSEPMIVPSVLTFAFFLSVAAGLISSYLPALRASRQEIAQALRAAN